MVKPYYTVIVGTQPGVYRDWTQVAPKVTGIPGAIHKKFKTHAEAWAAFNRATHEDTVRRIDPGSDTASSSDPPRLPRVARDNRQRFRRQHRAQGHHGHEIERPEPTIRPATRLQSYFRRVRTTGATHPNIVLSAHAGPSGVAERTGRITVGGEPEDRHQSFNQESRPTLEHVDDTESSASPSSRQVGPPTRGRSHERRWQVSQHGPVDAQQSSSRAGNGQTAVSRREARSPLSTSTERRRRSRESPETALLGSADSRLPRIEDDLGIPGSSAAHADGAPPRSSPPAAQIGRTGIEPEAYTPGSPIASSRAYDEGDQTGRRASVQSFDEYPDLFDWSEIQGTTFYQQTTVITDDHWSVPVLSRPSSVCSHISLASSAESFRSVMSFDVPVEAVETSESPGPSAHVVVATPQRVVSPFSISSLVEDTTLGPPVQSQRCLNDEENGTNALTTTRPLCTPSDDSRSFGFLVDTTSPLRRTHSPQIDHRCLGQSAPEDCPDLSRSSPPPVIPSTSRSTTHPLTLSSHLSVIDISASSPYRAWPPLSTLSPPPRHIGLDVSVSPEVIGLGLSIEDVALPFSQYDHDLPYRTASQSSPSILANQPAGSTEAQSPTRDDGSRRDAHMSQGNTPPSCSRTVAYDRAPNGGTRSMNGAVPSPRNVPLPPSPSTPRSATSGTSPHLQAQPSHRSSPTCPFYPSLTGDDRDDISDRQSTRAQLEHRLSPSGLHITFGLPSLGFTPVFHVPALIRSPSTDPHSPIHLGADTGCRRRRRIHHGINLSRTLFFDRPTPPGNHVRIVP